MIKGTLFTMENTVLNHSDFTWQEVTLDNDELIYSTTFTAPMTKNNRKAVESFVRRFNSDWRSPYGVGYSCGHVHDCCGCLVSKRMFVEWNSNGATLNYKEYYNY